ncbi:hypothetical protein JQX13_41135 [Archangium violaceum]|uniref:hypothetical protein n=1 Tax=Archangium violaceum TaxID=83451 RepID=UPI00193B7C1F|nr:hypothetical protein JQX13_41135 [Archangium violaceum]
MNDAHCGLAMPWPGCGSCSAIRCSCEARVACRIRHRAPRRWPPRFTARCSTNASPAWCGVATRRRPGVRDQIALMAQPVKAERPREA